MKFIQKYIKCPECGFIYPVLRKVGRDKKAGHLKSQWCIKCKKRINHIELDDKPISVSLERGESYVDNKQTR